MRDEYAAAGSYHFELAGEYDLARKPEVAELFGTVSNGSPVTIDMRHVTYVDSSFLSELVAMRLRAAERSVTLIGAKPNIERVMRIAKLDRLFDFRAG